MNGYLRHNYLLWLACNGLPMLLNNIQNFPQNFIASTIYCKQHRKLFTVNSTIAIVFASQLYAITVLVQLQLYMCIYTYTYQCCLLYAMPSLVQVTQNYKAYYVTTEALYNQTSKIPCNYCSFIENRNFMHDTYVLLSYS